MIRSHSAFGLIWVRRSSPKNRNIEIKTAQQMERATLAMHAQLSDNLTVPHHVVPAAGGAISMSIDPDDDVSRLLEAMASGDSKAIDGLVPLVYRKLRQIARRQLARERPDHTLESGALVNETYLRLVGLRKIKWQGQAHFLAAAAGAMRRILIDHAVRRSADKRGGGIMPVTLSGDVEDRKLAADDLLALDLALEELRALDARQAAVVEHRFFAGMTIEQSATVLNVSPMTVKRDWTAARAWLNRALTQG